MHIIVISGWGDQITEEQKNKFGVRHVMTKPIKVEQLKKIINGLE
jgi:FixJ family two-component response regulator